MEYYQPPAPLPIERRNRKLAPLILAGCGFLLTVGLILGIFAGKAIRMFRSPSRAVKVHLEAINKSQIDVAYTGFTTHYRRNHSLAEFRSKLASFSNHLPLSKTSLNHVNISNEHATVEGMLTGRNGVLFPATYSLVREPDGWKIDNFEWQSPGEILSI
jgi:hypothetical protein